MSVALDRVDNQRLREEFLRRRDTGLLSAELVAIRLGWEKRGGDPDNSRVLRVLGVKGSVQHGRFGVQKSVSYERACRLAEAMGIDFHEVDL